MASPANPPLSSMWDFPFDDLVSSQSLNHTPNQPWQENLYDWSSKNISPFRLPSPECPALSSSTSSTDDAYDLDALFKTHLRSIEQSRQPLPAFPHALTGPENQNGMLDDPLPQKPAGETTVFPAMDASRPEDAASLIAPALSLCSPGSDTYASSDCCSVELTGSPKLPKRTPVRPPKSEGNRGIQGSPKVSKRVPHHEVERKYRNGLNRQLERLRDAIPSAREANATGTYGKLSKTVILTSAIDYIALLEQKLELMRREKEMLYDVLRISDKKNSR